MWHVVLCSCALSWVLWANTDTAELQIEVFDTFGRDLKVVRIDIRSEGGELVRSLAGGATLRLPVGQYRLRATASLHQSVERLVDLRGASRQLVWLALPFYPSSHSEDVHPTLRGTVMGTGEDVQNLRVRVVSIYGALIAEGVVASDGTFEIREVPPGAYFGIVLRNRTVISVTEFTHMIDQKPALLDVRRDIRRPLGVER
jgi:hypothetical protein